MFVTASMRLTEWGHPGGWVRRLQHSCYLTNFINFCKVVKLSLLICTEIAAPGPTRLGTPVPRTLCFFLGGRTGE